MGCVGKDDSSRILSEKVRFGIFPGLAQERIVLPFNGELFCPSMFFSFRQKNVVSRCATSNLTNQQVHQPK